VVCIEQSTGTSIPQFYGDTIGAQVMERLKYKSCNEDVRKGDHVTIKRRLLPNLKGLVIYVYDPEKEIIPQGDNEYGFTIELSEGKYRWYDQHAPEDVLLISRG